MLEGTLLTEINPKYDLARHKFNVETWGDVIIEPAKFVLNSGKSLIRGGFVGALVGLGTGYLLDDVDTHTIGCSILGAGLDITQYQVRFMYQVLKRDILSLRTKTA